MDAPNVYLAFTDYQQEWYEERVAILQHEARLRRHLAEAEASRVPTQCVRAEYELAKGKR